MEEYSQVLRTKLIDSKNCKLAITNFTGSVQSKDFQEPTNCKGFGRLRHYKLSDNLGWPPDPLPIIPACKSLGKPLTSELTAQLFQIAACNWRCWYCFVDYSLLSADPEYSSFLSTDDLVKLYTEDIKQADVIVLSGGHPDLVPEWVPWMMLSLKRQGLEDKVYLWSDDNLSNDYFWTFLTEKERALISSYPLYGRACCFKGFDEESFVFNTRARPESFIRQFEVFKKLLLSGIDLYCYATFTTPNKDNITEAMPSFIDRLQNIHVNLPLRVVPLKIREYTPTKERMLKIHQLSLDNQLFAIEIWNKELEKRFSYQDRDKDISSIKLTLTS